MSYEVKIIKITSNGCCLIHTQDYPSDKEIEEITVYNKKLRCFMSKTNIYETKDRSSRIKRKAGCEA